MRLLAVLVLAIVLMQGCGRMGDLKPPVPQAAVR